MSSPRATKIWAWALAGGLDGLGLLDEDGETDALGESEALGLSEALALLDGDNDAAHESGQTMLHVLNDILDVSKIEAGKLTLETDSIDHFAALRSALSLSPEPLIDNKKILLTIIPPMIIPIIYGLIVFHTIIILLYLEAKLIKVSHIIP